VTIKINQKANIFEEVINKTYTLNADGQDHTLKEVKEEKDLGIWIDSELDFDKHINAKIQTANNMLGLIRRSYKSLDQDTFLPLYKTMVRSHFDYGTSVWNPSLRKHIEAIENVQRRATKMIPGLHSLEYEDRLRKLKLPTLVYRRLRGDMIETFKVLNGIYDNSVTNEMFQLRDKRTNRVGL